MAKRYIENDLFKDPFIRGLEGSYKTLYIYLFCSCDNAGLWPVELDVASFRTGFKFNKEKALKLFKNKIIELDGGMTWFIPSFIKIQYNNDLKPGNPAVSKVIQRLLKYDLIEKNNEIYQLKKGACKGLLKDPMVVEEEEEEEKEKEEEVVVEIWPTFEDFWNEYDKKVGKPKSETLWNKLKQKEKEEAFYYIADYKDSKPDKKFRKDPERYLKYKTWNDEIIKRNNGSGITEDDLREISGKITN